MLPTDLSAVARVWLERRGTAVLGEREAALLGAIERARSIKEAAKAAGISYRTAWACLQSMERSLGTPVVRSRAGGPGGGVTTLTDDTRTLLRLYTDVRRRVDAQAATEFKSAVARTP
jgi:molybdate transport system regulatory protein